MEPLAALWESLGATVERRAPGAVVALRFGPPEAELEALRGGCAVAERPRRDRLELSGADRERFLNGMVTCKVEGLAPGQGRPGFFTDIKGKILADAVVLGLEERFAVEVPAGCGGRIEGHLRQYVIADRVELAAVAPEPALLVAGPGARPALETLVRSGRLPGETWSHAAVDLAAGEARVVADGGWRLPAFALWAGAGVAADVARALARGGARPVGREALDILRVEEGVTLFGVDFDSGHFPQETGRDEAVSYDKGCYLGQEVVARIHYRGKVNRVPRGLLMSRQAAPGTALLDGGREVGRVTTSVMSPRFGAAGLALVHRRSAAPGTDLALAAGGEARVAALPLGGGGGPD